MEHTHLGRALLIQSVWGDDVLQLHSLHGTSALGRPFLYSLEIGSARHDLAPDEIVGSPVVLALCPPDGAVQYLHGIVSHWEQLESTSRIARYRAQLVPATWPLALDRDCRIFQDQTTPQILELLLGDLPGMDIEAHYTEEYAPHPCRFQYLESTLDFAHRLMEDAGIYYYFRHEADRHVMVLTDSLAAHQPNPGLETVAYCPHEPRPDNSIARWEITRTLRPNAYATADFDYSVPSKDLFTGSGSDAEHHFIEAFEFPGRHDSYDTGRTLAAVRREELDTSRSSFWGTTQCAGLQVGGTFRLQGHHRKDQNQSYLVTETELEISSSGDGMPGESDTGPIVRCRFKAMEEWRQFRPARVTRKPVVEGPQTAIVLSPEGETDDIWTDDQGRILVGFHWERAGRDRDMHKCLVRVSQGWASAGFGMMYLPRVGDEVIIDFLEGDPDRPIATGCLYNGAAPFPYELPKHKTVSTIKSHSSPHGSGSNELRFQDRKGHEQLYLHAQRRMDQRVGGSLYETNGGNREIRIGGDEGGSLSMLSNNDVNVDVKKNWYSRVAEKFYGLVSGHTNLRCEDGLLANVVGDAELGADRVLLSSPSVNVMADDIRLAANKGLNVTTEELLLEADKITLAVGQNCLIIDASGITIQGQQVRINQNPPMLPGMAELPDQATEMGPSPDTSVQQPLEALGAAGSKILEPGKGGRGGGGGRKRGPGVPNDVPVIDLPSLNRPNVNWPVPPPPPVVPEDEKCGLESISASCEGGRTAHEDEVLGVVPHHDDEIDEISLEAKLSPDSVGEVNWLVNGADNSAGTGTNFKFLSSPQNNWDVWIPGASPNEYAVSCTVDGGCEKTLDVEAFPYGEHHEELTAKHASPLADWLYNLGNLPYIKEIGELTGILKVKEGKAIDSSVTTGWREHTDHRAFYYYWNRLHFDPLYDCEFKFTLVPGAGWFTNTLESWLVRGVKILGTKAPVDWIKSWIERFMEVGFTAHSTASPSLDVTWRHTAPTAPTSAEEPFAAWEGPGMSGKLKLRLSSEIPAPTPLFGIPIWSKANLEFHFSPSGKPFIDYAGMGIKDYEISLDGIYLYGSIWDPTHTWDIDWATEEEPFELLSKVEEPVYRKEGRIQLWPVEEETP